MSFKKYVEAADLAESIFGKWFGKNTPESDAAKNTADKIAAIPELDIRNNKIGASEKQGKEYAKDAEDMVTRLKTGNLYQALNFYNGLINKSGTHYPPEIIKKVSRNQVANDYWDKKYREMFLKTYRIPADAKFLLDKAFSELRIPPVQSILPNEISPVEEPVMPTYEEIVNYIKILLSDERIMNKEEIVEKVKAKFPALGKANSKIGKAFKKAKDSSFKIYSPPAEPVKPREKPRKRNNVLKFPNRD